MDKNQFHHGQVNPINQQHDIQSATMVSARVWGWMSDRGTSGFLPKTNAVLV
ncbi:hypothetical protein [Peribacillus muralis]|uniref:hypothetical protein n=1 Tax=Peribacillus muralis TaxID=264697 RepID=UPI000A55B585|nr:hypothetical protein [Peribacillus muralis]